MPRIPVGFEVVDKGTRLRMLEASVKDPRWILTGIGALLVSASQRAFREEKIGKVRWKTRAETGMVPNWPGILADFAAGRSSPPARRFGAQHTLTDTGRLRGSINFRVAGMDTVEVGSNVNYASVLHEGGESETVEITKTVQERLWKWMKRAQAKPKRFKSREAKAKAKGPEALKKARGQMRQDAKVAGMTERLRWLLNPKLAGQKLKVNHPQRPLVGVPPHIAREIAARYRMRVMRG